MKKLLTLLLLSIVFIPLSARNYKVRLYDASGGSHDVSLVQSNGYWTADVAGSTMASYVKEGKIWFNILVDEQGETRTYYHSDSETNITDGSTTTHYHYESGSGKPDYITWSSDYSTKNFTFTAGSYDTDKSNVELLVLWDTSNIKLKGSYNGWAESDCTSYKDGIFTWDFTPTAFPSGAQFKLYKHNDNSYISNGSSITEDWSASFNSNEDNNMSATYDDTDLSKISVQAMIVPGGWKMRIVETLVVHDYYWVSPQVTRNEKWTYFKLVPSRNRSRNGGDGQISSKYYTFTIQDEFIKRFNGSDMPDDTQIQWYIVRDDGNVFYRPTSSLPVDDIPTTYDANHQGSGTLDSHVSFKNYWGEGYGDYKTTDTNRSGSFSFSKGSAKAYTFNLNAEKGHVFFNSTKESAATDIDYYLVGNFTSAKGEVDIPITDTSHKMTKWYYKDKVATQSPVENADSIVYKVNVAKPAEGWGDLYIDINPSGNTDWNQAIRPLINLGNNLDGRALHGGLVVNNSDQSLNPETSANYLGYTFSFNATTFTYQLEFHMPDVTLSPGTEDGEHKFTNESRATIDVNFSEASAYASAATKYAITLSADENFTLDESTKYNDPTFELSYDGTNILKDGTIVASNSNTVYVKVRGYDDLNQYGDIHTYQYTFYTPLSFEPRGGLFINSAKIKIEGGLPPYRYEIYNYGTKEEYGVKVIDIDPSKLVTSGTFDDVTYNADDKYYRISTPGFLKITDQNGSTVSYDVVGGGFDFTYSTSENYKTALSSTETKPNGDDYCRVMPTDYTWKVGKTWERLDPIAGNQEESWQVTSGKHWSGDPNIFYLHMRMNEAYQTVTDLPAGTYTVQAIVRGGGVPVYLKLNDEQVASINLTADADDAKTTINKFGRSEQLVEESLVAGHGWHKLEGTVTLATAGNLKIAVRTDYNGTGGSVDLADVYLLKDANTDGNYWTTAPTSEDVTEYDMSDRSKYNAFSFFDRGANLNSIIKADQKTVIGMSEDNEPYLTGAEKGARRHPCNVVTSSDGGTTWHTPMLALTDYASVIVGSENKYGGNPKVSQHAYGTTFAYTADKFSYDRATSAKMMSTMLPFPLTRSQIESMLGSGVKTYIYGGANKTTYKVTFSETSGELAANTPFFFLPVEAKTSMVLNQSVSVPATPAAAALAEGIVGTYKHTSNVGTYYKNKNFIPYFFQDGSFVWAQDNANAKPFRVVFLLGKGGNEARVLNVIFEDDAVTAIDGIAETNIDAAPVYSVDGKLVSSNGDISHLTKGVYVKAGKKFIIK